METEVPTVHDQQRRTITGLTEIIAALAITPIKHLYPTGVMVEVPILAESAHEVHRVAGLYGQVATVAEAPNSGRTITQFDVDFNEGAARLSVFHVG